MQIESFHSPETERAILGAAGLAPSVISKLTVQESDFYSERHRKIFRAMLELHRRGIPPDPVTLLEKLESENCLYLSECEAEVVSAANVAFYEATLKELSQKRAIQKICVNTLQSLGENSVEETLSNLRLSTTQIIKAGTGNEKLISSGEVAGEVWNFIERRIQDKTSLSGIPTGLKDLDRVTDGLQRGDQNILAGRPGSGKSALSNQIALNAVSKGFPVGIISLEMGSHQLGIRSLSNLSKVQMWKLRKGILSSSELKAVAEASERLTGLPICFSFCSRDAKEISPTITEMVEVHSCALVILDYLQLAKASASKERREREIAEISWTLKTAALTHNIPILCLSQLNRESERQNRKPILADLRESGAIEQDADVVMFLSREEADNGSSGPVEILIAKGRNIGTGSVTVYFDAERMTFRDLQRREDVHD